MKNSNSGYERIEKAISYLESHFQEQPNLGRLAQASGLSPFHFQRLFKRWAGVSPKQFLGYLTVQHAKARLARSRSVLDSAYDAGLSGPGRLHDLMVSIEAMSPGEYKSGGKGLVIQWGVHPTPFGLALIAMTPRGICALSFLEGRKLEVVLKELQKNWPRASWVRENHKTAKTLQMVFGKKRGGIRVLLKGTDFQIKVWEALLHIPEGSVWSYQDVAVALGKPKASRAVGTAVGRNAIAYLIPCHRVIRETGLLGDYRWGSARKKAILGWEEVHSQE
jgi:AraC family transcriptional regulator of adaptative response/methylated-DNA-[protein]-cysteine methyltransferase